MLAITFTISASLYNYKTQEYLVCGRWLKQGYEWKGFYFFMLQPKRKKTEGFVRPNNKVEKY
jgi:hypothetical protein